MKKYLKYLLAFIIPIIIFCLCLFINKMAPLGEYRITIYDSQVQYPAFFLALKRAHFYMFNAGFGFNFFDTITYYLMSPLNLLIHFFDFKSYNTFYFLIIILKIGLCGLCMQILLSHEKKHDNMWSVIFSIIYALIGFTSAYYYNVFWLDGIIMLPIILLGINKFFTNKSSLLYILSLAISIIVSFYTGYISCIFCVIYFIYKLVEENRYKDKKIILRFIISSIISALIACFVLIPSFFALKNGKISGYTSGFTKYFEFNSNIKYFLYSFLPGNYDSSQVGYGFAQNYCTLFVLTLFITSFFNKSISLKTKITTLIIIIFYAVCYSFNLFDFAWQFFQKPVWWQHRYSFTLSLFLIIVAYKNLMNFKNCQLAIIFKLFIYVVFTVVFTITFIIFYKALPVKSLFRIFIFCFSLLLFLNYIFMFDTKGKYKYIIIFFIFLELATNTFINVKQNNNKNTEKFDVEYKINLNNQIDKIKKRDSDFYRLELINNYTYNDGLLFDYNGINYFNSVRNQKVVDLMENYLNLTVDSHCSFVLNKFDPFIISLFNIKYLVGNESLEYFRKISDDTYINDYPLSIGFMSKNNLAKIKLKDKYYYDNMNTIFSNLLGENLSIYNYLNDKNITLDNAKYNKKTNTYKKIDGTKDAYTTINFKAQEDMFIIQDYDNFNTKIYINDVEVSNSKTYIYVLKDDEVKIVNTFMNPEEKMNIGDVHYIKESDYKSIMQKLQTNTLKNIKIHGKHLFEADVNISKDKPYLFTTIAYEKGMIIKVNGKKVKPSLGLNAFVSLKLKEGKNKITIDYIPQGLISGTLISISGLIILIIYLKCWEKKFY